METFHLLLLLSVGSLMMFFDGVSACSYCSYSERVELKLLENKGTLEFDHILGNSKLE